MTLYPFTRHTDLSIKLSESDRDISIREAEVFEAEAALLMAKAEHLTEKACRARLEAKIIDEEIDRMLEKKQER